MSFPVLNRDARESPDWPKKLETNQTLVATHSLLCTATTPEPQ
jgi:hypothetical protein